MHNLELEIMAMRAQQEHDLRKYVEEGRILQELRKHSMLSRRSDGSIIPFSRWRVADLLQRCHWRVWALLRRECDMPVSAGAD